MAGHHVPDRTPCGQRPGPGPHARDPASRWQLRISGSKIFISGGEHDLTDNIIHLVLARLPDAPAGPKGLSLFLVPKVLPDGTRNAAHCDRIEEKMGLHGSPTCVMRFDGPPDGSLASLAAD
jgi:alkylation response protein AidB-like acyl-CoA dehydrogenase